jgi:hypothetical protein
MRQIGFKDRFILSLYVPCKPAEWGIKARGITKNKTGYFQKCEIYLGKRKREAVQLLLGSKLLLT